MHLNYELEHAPSDNSKYKLEIAMQEFFFGVCWLNTKQ